MFRNLLKPDSGLMITMTQITDCIFLSLFFFLGSIPVVTLGASCAALYDASFRAFRKGEKHSWHRFWEVYRKNLKPGLIPTAAVLAVFLTGGWGMIRMWNAAAAGTISWMVFSGAALIAMALLGILSLVFPVLSRFENSTSALLKNAVFLGMANLPAALGLGILNAAAILLCLFYVVPLFFLPSLAALLGSLFIEPMFKPYLPEKTE